MDIFSKGKVALLPSFPNSVLLMSGIESYFDKFAVFLFHFEILAIVDLWEMRCCLFSQIKWRHFVGCDT